MENVIKENENLKIDIKAKDSTISDLKKTNSDLSAEIMSYKEKINSFEGKLSHLNEQNAKLVVTKINYEMAQRFIGQFPLIFSKIRSIEEEKNQLIKTNSDLKSKAEALAASEEYSFFFRC